MQIILQKLLTTTLGPWLSFLAISSIYSHQLTRLFKHQIFKPRTDLLIAVPLGWCAVNRGVASGMELCDFVWKQWAELLKDEGASPLFLVALYSELYWALQDCVKQRCFLPAVQHKAPFPPSLPLCNHFINSLASLSSPFTEQAHNKTHSVTLCIFTPSLLALYETASPSQPAPHGAFLMCGVASGLFSDWAIYGVVKRRQRRHTLKVSRRWH